jgi:hypothetical protein
MYREDVPYLTFTPHLCLQAAWTRHYTQPELFYPDRLLKLRELAADDPDVTMETLEDEAVKARARDEKNDAIVEKQKLHFVKGKQKGGRVLRKTSTVTKAKASKTRVSTNVNEASPLYGFQVGLSKSSKINWIVQEVRPCFVCFGVKSYYYYYSHKGPSIRGRREIPHFLQEPSLPRASFRGTSSREHRLPRVYFFL